MPRIREGAERSSAFHLLPIANLATLLIPVAVMGTQIVASRWLDADPAMPLENPGDADLPRIVPVIEVGAHGFRILGAEAVLAGPGGQPVLPCAGDLCNVPGAFDYAGLQRLLGHVKSAWPWAEEAVVVVVDDFARSPVGAGEFGLDVVVRTMETVRGDTQRELFPRARLAERPRDGEASD